MNYKDIIQSPGKSLQKRVQYYKNYTLHWADDESFESVKFGFNFGLTDGTICRWMELEMKEDLGLVPSTDYVKLYIKATLGTTTKQYASRLYWMRDPKPEFDANKKTYIYRLYDGMLKSMIPYTPITITYPCTCQQYFEGVVTALGWTTAITLGVTGSKTFTEDIYDGLNYTYRDILSDILQANGKLAVYKENNSELTEVNWLDNSVPSITIDDDILKNQNVELGQKYGPINSLTLSRANGTDLLVAKDDDSITSDGLTNITIADNHLLNDEDRGDYINALFNRFSGYEWYIYDCELTGYGGFTEMDKIKISTNSEDYVTYVFNNEIEISESYEETIYSEEQDQQVGSNYTYANTDEKADINAEIIFDKKIGEVDIRGKTIKMTADNINIESTNFKVDNLGNVVCNSSTMKDATINGGNVELHDLGKDERASLKIKKDIATYTPVVGQSQSIYSISLENPNAYMGSGATQETEFLQFTRGSGDDIETRTYTYSSDGSIEWINENIYNPNPNNYWNLDTVIWIYDGNVLQFIQPYSFQTTPSYLTFTKYDTTIPATQYFKFVNQVEDGITEANSEEVITERIFTYPHQLGKQSNSYSTLYNFQLSNGVTQGGMFLQALDYSGSGSSGVEMIARTEDPSVYPMPLKMNLMSNGWTRDIMQNQILWGNGPSDTPVFLNGSQTIDLAHNISEQPHGIVIVWSAYSNGAKDYNWHCDFIPKQFVQLNNGGGYTCIMASSKFENMATKYIYIYDDQITGHADNNSSSTTPSTAGVKYSNTAYVIRYVIGV